MLEPCREWFLRNVGVAGRDKVRVEYEILGVNRLSKGREEEPGDKRRGRLLDEPSEFCSC